MKQRFFRVFLLMITLLLVSLEAGEKKELLENGGFQDGKRYWNGDLKIETDGDNNYLLVEAKERKEQSFEQRVKTKDIKDFTLKFRYKTSDAYKGRGLKVSFERPGGNSTYRIVEVAASGEWKELDWKFGELANAEWVLLKVEIREGSGNILFDDFTIAAE